TSARLVYNGKSYVESWPYYEGGISHVWLEIKPEGSTTKFIDVIHSDTLLERIGNSPTKEFVNDALCLFEGDYVSMVQCGDMCEQINHPNILGGGCISNVCFCSWYLQDETYKITYLSLRTSPHISKLTIENFIKESKRDGASKTVQNKPRLRLRPDVKYTPDGLFKIPPRPMSDSEDYEEYDYEDELGFSDEELQPSPKRICKLSENEGTKKLYCNQGNAYLSQRVRESEGSPMDWEFLEKSIMLLERQCFTSSPTREPKASCSRDNTVSSCAAEPEEVKCYYGTEEISEDECSKRCFDVGIRTGTEVTKGFCEENCVCLHFSNGSCMKTRLTNLEKKQTKRRKLFRHSLRFYEDSDDPSVCYEGSSREYSH
ncbi:hypothetical protein QAD02_006880, partial [Eretmocerus hayati]